MSFQLNDWYTANLHGTGRVRQPGRFPHGDPIHVRGDANYIFRVTQPYVTSSPSGATGFTDTTVFDLVVFGAPWGRWGVGVSGTLPTGEDGLTTNKWTAGPALGFVNSSDKQYNWGLFTQTFFSFAGKSGAQSVGLINIQPIYSYQLGEGRSLGLGNSALVYDVEKSRWSSLMLSVNYGQVAHLRRPQVAPERRGRLTILEDDFGNQRWVLRAAIVLLLPT